MSAISIEDKKALSRRLYEEVFGKGNLSAADEILAESCVSHGPGSPPQIGAEAIKRQALALRSAMPDLWMTLEDQVADGDRVASRWTGRGTHTGVLPMPSGPVQPTGAAIEIAEIRIDRYASGQIVESWFIPDRFTLWQQMGLIPRPEPPSR